MAARQPFVEDKDTATGACGPSGWAPPPAAPDDLEAATDRAENRKNIAMAVCTMLLSIPALIGSWCWPIFVGVIFGMLSGQGFGQAAKNAASHDSTIAFFHGLQVAITMMVMFSIVQYAYWTCLSRRQNVTGHWAKFGPVYILLVAATMVTIQPMMILIIGSWYPKDGPPAYADTALSAAGVVPVVYKYPELHAFYAAHPELAGTCKLTPDAWPCTNAFWNPSATNSFFPNQTSGWLIQVFCTYVGYILLVVGVVQATDMVGKMRRTWRMARG